MIKKIATALILFTLIINGAAIAAGQDKEQEAINAAQYWLGLVDNAKFAESWTQAAVYAKNAVSKEQWAQSIKAAREPLGKVISRAIRSAQYMTSIPGGPDGEYVVIQFDTSFENKKAAVETVTPMMEKDGKWRVSGYYIR